MILMQLNDLLHKKKKKTKEYLFLHQVEKKERGFKKRLVLSPWAILDTIYFCYSIVNQIAEKYEHFGDQNLVQLQPKSKQ